MSEQFYSERGAPGYETQSSPLIGGRMSERFYSERGAPGYETQRSPLIGGRMPGRFYSERGGVGYEMQRSPLMSNYGADSVATATADQGIVTADQGVVLADQGVALADQGVALADQGVALADQGVVLADQGGAMADQGGAMADQDGATADQGGAMADQGGVTADQGGVTADQGGATQKLTQEQRRAQICIYLRTRIVKKVRGEGFRIDNGAFEDAARKFGCKPSAVQRWWRRYRDAICHPDKYQLDVARKKGSGYNRKHELEEVLDAVKKVPCRYRHSLRILSEKVGIPKSTLHRVLKEVGLADGAPVKKEATAVGGKETSKGGETSNGGETSEGQTMTISQKTQNEMRQIQLEQARATEMEKAVEAAKLEARREYDLKLEILRDELRREFQGEKEEIRNELRREFEGEKEKVLYRLRVEMERHSMELARLNGELVKVASDIGSGGGLAKAGKGTRGSCVDASELKMEEEALRIIGHPEKKNSANINMRKLKTEEGTTLI